MSDTTEPRPSIEDLIERSSLGTPEAKALRAQTPEHVAREIVRRSMEPEPVPPWMAGAVPPSVTDSVCPDGHLIQESTERRWLWWLEGFLAVSGTNEAQRNQGRNLARYLIETCAHHWHEYPGDLDIPAHRQCLWCSDVEWNAAPDA